MTFRASRAVPRMSAPWAIVLQNSAGSIAKGLIFLVASTLYGLLIVFK
jgi:hypothetical protein